MTKRLNIRIDESDYAKLQELRKLMYLSSDSSTVRVLIRFQHKEMQAAVRQLRKREKMLTAKKRKER